MVVSLLLNSLQGEFFYLISLQGDLFVTELCTSAFLGVISLQVDLFVAELTLLVAELLALYLVSS